MPCYEFANLRPVVDPTAFVHPTAVLIGDVIVGAECYIGPGASLRGDFGRLIVEAGSNVQDLCVLHSFPGSEAVVEEGGHIGHAAVLHGCRIGRNSLIGMSAVIMDGVTVGAESIVGALSFVKAGLDIPPRSMVVGAPAQVTREVTGKELTWKQRGTDAYVRLARQSLATMRECVPLDRMEEDRLRIVGDNVPLHIERTR